jgi:hypothetical protein
MSELMKLLSEVDVFVNIRELNFRDEHGSKLTSMSEYKIYKMKKM